LAAVVDPRRALEENYWIEVERTVEGLYLPPRTEESRLEFVRSQENNLLGGIVFKIKYTNISYSYLFLLEKHFLHKSKFKP
jgi:hypothetical protein